MNSRMSKDRVTPIIRMIRDFLNQRVYNNALRYEGLIVKRSVPKPNIPEGVHHKLSKNDYFQRSGRGEVSPPQILYQSHVKAIEGNIKSEPEVKDIKLKLPTPGALNNWDSPTVHWDGYWYEYDNDKPKKHK